MAEMSQDDIDALMNMGGGDEAGAGDEVPDAGGNIGQDDIDALLNMGGGDEASGDTGQGVDDMEALLNEASGTGGDTGQGADDMEALLAEIQEDPNLGAAGGEVNVDELLTEIQPESAFAGDSAQMGQGDIQSLIDSVQGQGGAVEEVQEEEASLDVDFLLDMQLTVTFEVGRSKMKIGDLLSLGQGSVIELHRLVGEDLDLFVSGKLIAKGEVVVVNEKFGVRILEIVQPENRIKLLGGMDRHV